MNIYDDKVERTDECVYCHCKETEENELAHGAVFDDAMSDKPVVEDWPYCEDCANGNMNLPHRFFQCCNKCDREFVDGDELQEAESGDNLCKRCMQKEDAKEICQDCKCVVDDVEHKQSQHIQGLCDDCERARVELYPDLVFALKLHMKFWDEMPKGQLGKIVCDIGILNDAFIKSDEVLKQVTQA